MAGRCQRGRQTWFSSTTETTRQEPTMTTFATPAPISAVLTI
ncbi:hypothetical protein BCF44_1181, partial [Kutzneria buriramensis]